ncbi:MAG: hypothetical protein JWO30_3085 [Fibrobacteres bacterium]|nr:hypothetical protein [Fibrobacterota bacterium]
MIKARRLAALLPFLGLALALVPTRAIAGVDLDGGVRAAIFDENYKLGVGGELGVIAPAAALWDLGLHLNYTHFKSKTETLDDATELGGYVAAYYKPALDQGFSLRLGPHIGYSELEGHFLDLGGDVMAVFKITPALSFYGAFIPSFLIGSDTQSLFRIGLGLEYHTGS